MNQMSSYKDKLKIWDEGSARARKEHPLKTLSTLPNMPGITPETAKGLKWKSIKYLLSHDHNGIFKRYFFKHPIKYGFNFLKSIFKKESYSRSGDFFLYGIPSVEAFEERVKQSDSHLVVGFSYCHKPFECPSGRFSAECIHDPEHPVCRQCFIGKAVHVLPPAHTPLFIPTVHYIGEKMFELAEAHPDKKLVFLITACEMTLKMFGDWGNMLGATGIGVRLDGRICNTMRAFELSERGIKPGLTVVLPETEQRILDLIRTISEKA